MKEKNKFKINYKATFDLETENDELKLWFSKPKSDGFQDILECKFSPEPKDSYFDDNGNEILYFVFNNIKKINFEMEISVTLSKYNNNFPTKINIDKSEKRFLKDEKFIEQNKDIVALAKKITEDKTEDIEKIKSIFKYVANNFEYSYPVEKRGVNNLNLNKLKGDCAEYSSLFVAMARILGYPARNETGFIVFENNIIEEHGWASVLMNGKWLDFDIQYASLEENIDIGIDKYFGKRSEYRLIFTNGFNVDLKPSIGKEFDLSFWNKNGLPITSNGVQTLQPLVFVSNGKVEFSDNMQIKNETT